MPNENISSQNPANALIDAQAHIERELPYDAESEAGVIGSCLTSADAVADAVKELNYNDFYLTANREIFAVICELFSDNTPIDFITVNERLNRHNKLDAVGGTTYLSSLVTHTYTSQNVKYYSHIIKQKSILRQLIKISSQISDSAYTSEDDVRDILSYAQTQILKIDSDTDTRDIVKISETLNEVYEELNKNYHADSDMNGLDTGFDMLNKNTGGFHPGELIIIAGRPGMGKSSFAVNIAEHVALKNNKTVAIFNLEMPRTQIVNRIITSQATIASEKLRKGDLSVDDWMKLNKTFQSLYQSPIFIDDSSGIKVNEIKLKCKLLKERDDLQLVVIDYLQLMDVEHRPGRSDSRQNDISEISRSLKVMAKELGVPVIALSQLSRQVENRTDKRPQLSDLRESGAIEQDADLVMFLYRDDYYKKEASEKPGIAELIVAKNRSGQTGNYDLGWKGEYTKFVNIEYHAKEN